MKLFDLIDSADQQFSAILGGQRVTLRFRYNPTSERWSLDLAIDDQWVLHGRRIVLGQDLLANFNLGIGSIFALETKEGSGVEPDYDNVVMKRISIFHASEDEISGS